MEKGDEVRVEGKYEWHEILDFSMDSKSAYLPKLGRGDYDWFYNNLIFRPIEDIYV